MTIFNAMATCMSGKVDSSGNFADFAAADANCRETTSGMASSDTSAAATAARTFWGQVEGHLLCCDPCFAC
jgi:hypothetical protein